MIAAPVPGPGTRQLLPGGQRRTTQPHQARSKLTVRVRFPSPAHDHQLPNNPLVDQGAACRRRRYRSSCLTARFHDSCERLPSAARIVHGCPAASTAPPASHAMAQAPPLTRPASRAMRQLRRTGRSLRPRMTELLARQLTEAHTHGMKRDGALATTFAALTVMTGCTTRHAQPSPTAVSPAPTTTALQQHGTVHGQLILEAGGHVPFGVPGTVTISGPTRQTTITVGTDGRYSATLGPGVYQLIGESPNFGGHGCVSTPPEN